MPSAANPLPPLRVLDLTNIRGHFCGKVLGDMGCDVVKIEPPGGDPARDRGPFVEDVPDRNRSLTWLAYNTSKRGVTLNIESEDGRGILRHMVEKADILIESFDPGYLDGLGLSYAELRKVKPDLIMTSITPFGQEGPYRDYADSDIVLMALGGFMSENGYPATCRCSSSGPARTATPPGGSSPASRWAAVPTASSNGPKRTARRRAYGTSSGSTST